MFKRLFWLTVGAGFGFGSSFWVTRRMSQFVQRWTPTGLKTRIEIRLEELSVDLRDAAEAGREQMHVREAELRHQVHPQFAPVTPRLTSLTLGPSDDEIAVAELLPIGPGPRAPRGRRTRS